MANFKRTNKNQGSFLNAVNSFAAAATGSTYSQFYTDKGLATAISTESQALSNAALESLQTSMEQIASHIKNTIESDDDLMHALGAKKLGSSLEGVQDYQIDAAAIVLASASNLKGMLNAQRQSASAYANIPSMGMESLYSGLNIYGDSVSSLESFEEKELNQYLQYSIIFNVLASRQDAFNEMFFKPLTLTPDDTGYRVAVRVEDLHEGWEHNPNGDVQQVTRRKLIDAMVHPEILDTNHTDVVPFYQKGVGGAGVDNTAHFVEGVEPYNVTVGTVSIKTAPLKIDVDHNVIGLSSHPALIANELFSEKDSLDSRIAVSNIYFKVGTKLVKFQTKDLFTSGMWKSVEGNMKSMTLNFNNSSYLISADNVAYDTAGVEIKEAVPEFKALADAGYNVRLNFRLAGECRQDTGDVSISALPVRIASITKDGRPVKFDKESLKEDTALKGLLAALFPEKGESKIKVVGYDLEARRLNYNLRTRGLLVDSTEVTEQITIPLRAPVSINKPIIGAEKVYPDVKALASACRIQANNDGVKTIINLADLLRSITSRKDYDYNIDRDAFPGIGRHFVNAFFAEETLHLPSVVNSVSSGNRLKDIQGAITTKINEIVGRMLSVTNYIPVIDQYTGGNPGDVQAIIGTDYRIPQYIITQGDVRLLGDKVGYQVESTPNKLMRNKIVISLSQKDGAEGPNPFTFGTFAWCPELMVSTQMQRGASTYHQDMAHPRYAHIVNLPVLAVLNVTGIEEVTGEATVLPVAEVTKDDALSVGNGLLPKAVVAAVADDKAPAGGANTPSAGGQAGSQPRN